MTGEKIRLDIMLHQKGLAESREKAKAMVMEGVVSVNGITIDKAGTLVKHDDVLTVREKMPYVSRGGVKLAHALETFGVDLDGVTAMDVGASTGGFTDCLLQHGAEKVYAIDVGYGQFSVRLRDDSRVVLLEKQNIRHLERGMIPDVIDLAVIDVSFISLLKVLPRVIEFLAPEGHIIALVKPQFEVGKKDVGKGGVVRDEGKRLSTVEKVSREAENMRLCTIGRAPSPIKGPKGNVEYFLYLKHVPRPSPPRHSP